MSKRKRNLRKRKFSSNFTLLPSLSKLTKEATNAQNRFDRLLHDNADLKNKLSERSRELAKAQQKADNLENECKSLKLKSLQAEDEIQRSEVNALVSFFKDMADEKNNRLLRKLLAFEEDKPKLLYNIAHYFRTNTKISLDGKVGERITLTDENIDRYEIQESVNLPCKAQVIGRGISYQDKSILRIQIELLDADIDEKENTNNGN